MPAPLFIGDELTATGFRLAGVRVFVPATEEPGAILEAIGDEPLVLIGAAAAKSLPEASLAAAIRSSERLVLVVPDAMGNHPSDLVAETRRTLDVLRE